MKKELEICAYSLESCQAAQAAGANRVELCSAMYDGGTTPSAATIQMARELLRIELFIMIRPRGGDFLYTDLEYTQMKADLLFAKSCAVDGVVIGLLKPDGRIDVERTQTLVALAAPLKVTFHRAFDMVLDYQEALKDVIQTGCHRILTSGLRNTAMEGLDTIRNIVQQADRRIQIMAGSGVGPANARIIAATGVNALHMSGKNTRDSQMIYRNPNVFMGGIPGIPEYDLVYSDNVKIKNVVEILNTINIENNH